MEDGVVEAPASLICIYLRPARPIEAIGPLFPPPPPPPPRDANLLLPPPKGPQRAIRVRVASSTRPPARQCSFACIPDVSTRPSLPYRRMLLARLARALPSHIVTPGPRRELAGGLGGGAVPVLHLWLQVSHAGDAGTPSPLCPLAMAGGHGVHIVPRVGAGGRQLPNVCCTASPTQDVPGCRLASVLVPLKGAPRRRVCARLRTQGRCPEWSRAAVHSRSVRGLCSLVGIGRRWKMHGIKLSRQGQGRVPV